MSEPPKPARPGHALGQTNASVDAAATPGRRVRLLPFVSEQMESNILRSFALLLLLLVIICLWLVFLPPTLREAITTKADYDTAKRKLDELIQARVNGEQITRGFSAAELNAYFRSLLSGSSSIGGDWLPAFAGIGFEVREHSVVMYQINEWRAVGLRVVNRIEAIPQAKNGQIGADVRQASIGQLKLPWPIRWFTAKQFGNMFWRIRNDPLLGTLPATIEIRGGEVLITNAMPPRRPGGGNPKSQTPNPK